MQGTVHYQSGFPITDDTSQLNNCLHARDSSLNFSKNEVFLCFWQQQIMHTASFLPRATIISQQVTHVLIHQFCDEWNKRSLKTKTINSLGFIQSQVSTTENITKIQTGTVHFGNCFNNLLNKDVKYMQEVIFHRHWFHQLTFHRQNKIAQFSLIYILSGCQVAKSFTITLVIENRTLNNVSSAL